MKKAYDESKIQNLHIREKAADWTSRGLITSEQLAEVNKHFPDDFYRPAVFVRIGLFLFSLLACGFFAGFLSMFFYNLSAEGNFSIMSLICAACYVFALEKLIESRKLFHSGVDNAILYAALIAAIIPVFLLFENADVWIYCLLALCLAIPATLRYADPLTTAASFVLFILLLGSLLVKTELGKALLPFSVMMLAAVVYFFTQKIRDRYFRFCRQLLEVLSLATFYLGGNYLVVREGNALLQNVSSSLSPQVAFAGLFYTLSIGIPLIYIMTGLKKYDRILLVTGLASLAFSAYTFYHYFSPLTISQSLTMVGLAMTSISAASIAMLRTPWRRLSDETTDQRRIAVIETIIAMQSIHQPAAPEGVKFGGGHFGGGGAGEVY